MTFLDRGLRIGLFRVGYAASWMYIFVTLQVEVSYTLYDLNES